MVTLSAEMNHLIDYHFDLLNREYIRKYSTWKHLSANLILI